MLPVDGWNDDKRDLLRKLWGSITARVIGERMGFSKNSVCGMANRMGLSRPRPAPVVREQGQKRDRSAEYAKRKEARVNRREAGSVGAQVQAINRGTGGPPRFKAEDFISREADVDPLRLSLLEVGDGECHFPFDATAEERERLGVSTVFCGHPVYLKGRSWCTHHARIAYAPPVPRVRRPDPQSRASGRAA